jgi:hypothetical protein
VIGTIDTPVRAVINTAAAMLKTPLSLLALVVTHDGTAGLFCGDPHEAWREAAMLSQRRHVRFVDRPFDRVLAVMPTMYDDLWTGAKGAYKTEPVVADGGEVIIYAPHISEVSYVHGELIDRIGYHCRDYFLAQWDRFSHYPWGILAHSTHVKGLGTYDAARRYRASGANGSTSGIWIRRRSIPRPGIRAGPVSWWCTVRERCSTGWPLARDADVRFRKFDRRHETTPRLVPRAAPRPVSKTILPKERPLDGGIPRAASW